jgi:hypothetical protein
MIDGMYLSEDEKRDCLRERARIDREVAEGRIVIADDEISAAQWERAERMLRAAGFDPRGGEQVERAWMEYQPRHAGHSGWWPRIIWMAGSGLVVLGLIGAMILFLTRDNKPVPPLLQEKPAATSPEQEREGAPTEHEALVARLGSNQGPTGAVLTGAVPPQLVLTVNSNLTFALGGQPFTREKLAEQLEKATNGNRDPVIYLRVDDSVPYGKAIEILQLLRSSGFHALLEADANAESKPAVVSPPRTEPAKKQDRIQ